MDAEEQAAQLNALLELQRDLALETDIDRVLQRIATAACGLLHVPVGRGPAANV